MKIKNKKRQVCFLDKNEEVKIVSKTIPHRQIFVSNKNGVFLVENYFIRKERLHNEIISKIKK